MIEMRWLLSREQKAGAFSEPLEWPDGSSVFARLQFREKGMAGEPDWQEIPVVSEIPELPRLKMVGMPGRGRH